MGSFGKKGFFWPPSISISRWHGESCAVLKMGSFFRKELFIQWIHGCYITDLPMPEDRDWAGNRTAETGGAPEAGAGTRSTGRMPTPGVWTFGTKQAASGPSLSQM
jgi:hypothetical protein